MATTDIAQITGRVLTWARKRAAMEPEVLAKKLGRGYTPEQIAAWERDEASPTFAQAESLVKHLRVPLAVLFLPDAPDIKVPLVDLRTVPGRGSVPASLNFFEVVSENVSRQKWYRGLRERQDASPLPFVGLFRVGDSVEAVARDIGTRLGITDELRQKCNTWEAFLVQFIRSVENAGVLVMRSGWAKHTWQRPLDVEEFRGFAISDRLAPLVFINTADAKAAQIFTLAHEVAHIWTGQSGISNPDPKLRTSDILNPIERYCNAVAAELLIPSASVRRDWKTDRDADFNVTRLATFHRVSKIAAAIRARDLGMISYDIASDIINAEYERFKKQRELLKEKAKEKEGGPGFWTGFTDRVSARFLDSVIGAVDGGDLMFREAADLLGVTLKTFDKYPSRRVRHA